MYQKLQENQQFYNARAQMPYFCSVELVVLNHPQVCQIDNFYTNKKDRENPIDRRKLPKSAEALASCETNIQSQKTEDQLRDLISVSYEVSDRRSLIYYQGPRRSDPFPNHAAELDVVVVNGEQPKIFFEVKNIFTQKEDCQKNLRGKLAEAKKQILRQGARLLALNPEVRGAIVFIIKESNVFETAQRIFSQAKHVDLSKFLVSRENAQDENAQDERAGLSNIITNQIAAAFKEKEIPLILIKQDELEAIMDLCNSSRTNKHTVSLHSASFSPRVAKTSPWDVLNQISFTPTAD